MMFQTGIGEIWMTTVLVEFEDVAQRPLRRRRRPARAHERRFDDHKTVEFGSWPSKTRPYSSVAEVGCMKPCSKIAEMSRK